MSHPMSHNILPEPTTRPDPSGNESSAFSQLRYSLIKVLRNSPESREPICDALELIESLQQQMEAKRHPDPAELPASRHARATQPQQQQQEYIVQKTPEGDFLTERRPSGSQPFRCPKPAYDAAARILADAREPLHFEEFLDRLNSATGERHADYRLRVCLRFWGQHKLIERFRTRYRALNAKTLVQDAEKLWEQLSR
jgi:hypothetical protein